jgi:hypothetical protein
MPRSHIRTQGARSTWIAALTIFATTQFVGCAAAPTATLSTALGSAPTAPRQQAGATANSAPTPGIATGDYSTTCGPGPWPPDLPNVTGTARADVVGAATTLVPFVPTSALLCLYIVDPDPHGIRTHSLVASRDVTGAALAGEIGAHLNSGATALPAGPMSCPKDSGTTLDVYLRNDSEQVEVEISTSGCRVATNGAYAASISAAEPYLESVVPFPPGVE